MFQINVTFNHNTTLGGIVSGLLTVRLCIYTTDTSSYIQPPVTKPERLAGYPTVFALTY